MEGQLHGLIDMLTAQVAICENLLKDLPSSGHSRRHNSNPESSRFTASHANAADPLSQSPTSRDHDGPTSNHDKGPSTAVQDASGTFDSSSSLVQRRSDPYMFSSARSPDTACAPTDLQPAASNEVATDISMVKGNTDASTSPGQEQPCTSIEGDDKTQQPLLDPNLQQARQRKCHQNASQYLIGMVEVLNMSLGHLRSMLSV